MDASNVIDTILHDPLKGGYIIYMKLMLMKIQVGRTNMDHDETRRLTKTSDNCEVKFTT